MDCFDEVVWGKQVHQHVTEHALSGTEKDLRKSALYIIDNLNLVTLALRLCDFKDVSVAVEAKHVGALSCTLKRPQCPMYYVCIIFFLPCSAYSLKGVIKHAERVIELS